MTLFFISIFFVASILFFEYQVFHCDRFREPKIFMHLNDLVYGNRATFRGFPTTIYEGWVGF